MKSWLVLIFVLVSAGLLFSGYLSAVKLFSGTCAFNESCPYFLGYPACFYGFVMYLAMFIVTLLALSVEKFKAATAFKADIAISLLGIFFSGSFAVQEAIQSSLVGKLGLSTCVYGLIFYVLIFAISAIALRESRKSSHEAGRGGFSAIELLLIIMAVGFLIIIGLALIFGNR